MTTDPVLLAIVGFTEASETIAPLSAARVEALTVTMVTDNVTERAVNSLGVVRKEPQASTVVQAVSMTMDQLSVATVQFSAGKVHIYMTHYHQCTLSSTIK